MALNKRDAAGVLDSMVHGTMTALNRKTNSGERNPIFDTILKVIGALGLKLHAEALTMVS